MNTEDLKMKKGYLITLIAVMLFMASCSKESVTGPVQPTKAQVKITIWTQPFLAYSYTYGEVEIEYTITNVCEEYISQYEVHFRITCENGSVYEVKADGIAVDTGESKTSKAFADTKGYKARSVELSTIKCW